MSKLWKVILFSILGLIGVIGITAGIMFLTGAFNHKSIFPENISFSKDKYEVVSDFSITIETTSEEYNESKIKLDFSNISNPTRQDGYISDGIITVPEYVYIGREFTCKINKLEDGFNNGGVSNLRARLVGSNIDFVTTKVYVDVPVDSIEVYFTDASGAVTTKFAKGSIINLNTKFIPERSKDAYRTITETNKEGDKSSIKRVEYEISQDYLEKYVKFAVINNVTYYDKLEVIGLTTSIPDLKAVVNAYVFPTLEEQNKVTEQDYKEDRFTNIRTSGVSGESDFETVNVELKELNFTKINNLSLKVNKFYNFYIKNNTSVNIPELDKYFNITVKSNIEGVDVSYRLNDLTLKAYYNNGTEVSSDLISITFVKDLINPTNSFWKVIVYDIINKDIYFEFKIENDENDFSLNQEFTTKIVNINKFSFTEDEKTLTFIDYEGEDNDIYEQLDLNKLIELTGENGETSTYTKIIYYIENYNVENQIIKNDNGYITNGIVIPKNNGTVNVIAKVVKTVGQKIVFDENNNYIFIDNFEAKIKINVNEGLTDLTISLIDNGIEKVNNGYLEDTDKIYIEKIIDNVTYKKYIDSLLLKVVSNNKPEILERELNSLNGLKFISSNNKVNLQELYDNANIGNFNYILNLKTLFSYDANNFSSVVVNSLKQLTLNENSVTEENEITNIDDYIKILKNKNSTSAVLMLTENRFSTTGNYMLNLTVGKSNTFNIVFASEENFEIIKGYYNNNSYKNYNLDNLKKSLTNDIGFTSIIDENENNTLDGLNVKMLYINGSFIKPSEYTTYITNNSYYIELNDNYKEVVCDLEILYHNEDGDKFIKEVRLNHNNNGLYYGQLKKMATFNEETNKFDIYYVCKISLSTLDSHEPVNVNISVDYINSKLNVSPVTLTIISKKVTEVSFEHNVYEEEQLKNIIGTIDNPIIINGKVDGDSISWVFKDENYKNVIFDADLNLKYNIYPNHASGYNIISENSESILVVNNENEYKISFIGIPSGFGTEEVDSDNNLVKNNTYITYVEIQSDYESDRRYDRLYFKFVTPIIESEVFYKDNLKYLNILGKAEQGLNLFNTILDTVNGTDRYAVRFYYYDAEGNKQYLTSTKYKIEDISSVKHSDYYSISENGDFNIIRNCGFNYNVILQISHSFGKSVQYEINVESILNVTIEYPTTTNSLKNLVYSNYTLGDGFNGSEVNKKYFVLPAGINGAQISYSLLNLKFDTTKQFIKSEYKTGSGYTGGATLNFEIEQNIDYASIEGNFQLVISSEKINNIKYLKLKVTSAEGYLDYVYIAIVPNIKIDTENINNLNLEIYTGENNKLEIIKFNIDNQTFNYDYDNSIIKLISRDYTSKTNFSFVSLDKVFSLSDTTYLGLEFTETGVNIVSKNKTILSEYTVKFKINYYNYVLSVDIKIKPNLFINGNGEYNSDGEEGTGLYNIRYNSDELFNSKLIVASYNTSYIKLFDLKDSTSLLYNYIKKYKDGKFVSVSEDNFSYSLVSSVAGIKINNNILEIPAYNLLSGIYNFIVRVSDASGFYVDVNLTLSPINLLSSNNDGTIFANITNNYEYTTSENNNVKNIDFYKFFVQNSLENVIYSTKFNAGITTKIIKEGTEGLFELNILNAEGKNVSLKDLDEGLYYEIIYLDNNNKFAEIKGNNLVIYDIASKNDNTALFMIKVKSSRLENSGFSFTYIVEVIPNLSFKMNVPVENSENIESVILQDGQKVTINLRETISSKYPYNVSRKRLEIFNKNNLTLDIADSYKLNYSIESGEDAVDSITINDNGIFVTLKYIENTTRVKIKFYHENGLEGYYNFEVKSSPKFSLIELKENKTGTILNEDNYLKKDKDFDLEIDDKIKIIFGKNYSENEASTRTSFDYKIINTTNGIKNITFDNNVFYKLNIDSSKDNYKTLHIFTVENDTIICFETEEDYLSKTDEEKALLPKLVLTHNGETIEVYAKCGVNSISGNLVVYTLDGVIASINITTKAKYSSNVSDKVVNLYSNQTYSLQEIIEITDTISNDALTYSIYLINDNGEYINNNGETIETGETNLIINGLNNTVNNTEKSVKYVVEFENGEKYYGTLKYNIISSIKDTANNKKLWPYNYVEDGNSYKQLPDGLKIEDLINIIANENLAIELKTELDISWAQENNIILVPSSYQDLVSKYLIFILEENEVTQESETISINGVNYYKYICDSVHSKQVNDTCEIELKVFNTTNNYLFDSTIKLTLYSDLITEINYNLLNSEEILETIFANSLNKTDYKYYLYGDNNNLLFTDKNRINFSSTTGRELKVGSDIIFSIITGSEYVEVVTEENNVYLKLTNRLPSVDTIIKIQIKVDNLITYYYNVNLSLKNPYLCEVVYNKTDGYYENDGGIIRQFITFESNPKEFNLGSSSEKFYINFVYNTIKNNNNQSVSVDINSYKNLFDFTTIDTNFSLGEKDISNALSSNVVYFNTKTFKLFVAGEGSSIKPTEDSVYSITIKDSYENNLNSFNFKLKRNWKVNKNNSGFNDTLELYAVVNDIKQTYNLLDLIGLTDLYGNKLSTEQISVILKNIKVAITNNIPSPGYTYVNYNTSTGELEINGAKNSGTELTIKITIFETNLKDFNIKVYSGITTIFEDTEIDNNEINKTIIFDEESSTKKDYSFYTSNASNVQIYYNNNFSDNILKDSNLYKIYIKGDLDYLDNNYDNNTNYNGYYLTSLQEVSGVNSYGLVFIQPMLGNKYITVKIIDNYGYEIFINFTLSPKYEIALSTNELTFEAGDYVNLFNDGTISIKPNIQSSASELIPEYFIKNIEVAYDNYSYVSVVFVGDKNETDEYGDKIYGRFKLDKSITSSTSYNIKFRITLGSGKDTGTIIIDKVKVNPSINYSTNYGNSSYPFNVSIGEMFDVTKLYNLIGEMTLDNISYNVTKYRNGEYIYTDDLKQISKGIYKSSTDTNLIDNIYRIEVIYSYNGITRSNYLFIKLNYPLNITNYNNTSIINVSSDATEIQFNDLIKNVNFVDYNGNAKLVRLNDKNLQFKLHSNTSGISVDDDNKTINLKQTDINFTSVSEEFGNIIFGLDLIYLNKTYENFINVNLNSYKTKDYVNSYNDIVINTNNLSSYAKDGDYYIPLDKIGYTNTSTNITYSIKHLRVNNLIVNADEDFVIENNNLKIKNVQNKDIEICLQAEINGTNYIQNVFISASTYYLNINNYLDVITSENININDEITFEIVTDSEENKKYLLVKKGDTTLNETEIIVYDKYSETLNPQNYDITLTEAKTTALVAGYIEKVIELTVNGQKLNFTVRIFDNSKQYCLINKSYQAFNNSQTINLNYNPTNIYTYYTYEKYLDLKLVNIVDGHINYVYSLSEIKNIIDFSFESENAIIENAYVNEELVGFNLTEAIENPTIKLVKNGETIYTINYNIVKNLKYSFVNAYQGDYKSMGEEGYQVVADINSISGDTQTFNSNEWASNIYILEYDINKDKNSSFKAMSIFNLVSSFDLSANGDDFSINADYDLIIPKEYSGLVKVKAILSQKVDNKTEITFGIYITNKTEYNYVETSTYTVAGEFKNKPYLILSGFGNDLSIIQLQYGGKDISKTDYDNYVKIQLIDGQTYLFLTNTDLPDNNYLITVKNNEGKTNNLIINRKYKKLTSNFVNVFKNSLTYSEWTNTIKFIENKIEDNIVTETNISLNTAITQDKMISYNIKEFGNVELTSSKVFQLTDTTKSGSVKLEIVYKGNNNTEYVIGEFEINFSK